MGHARKQTGAAAALIESQDSAMTKIDCLIEVAKKLREARALGERSSDRALIYFIDMTIAHVCDSLDTRSQTKGSDDDHPSPLRAVASLAPSPRARVQASYGRTM